jgi:hypothetical protein
MKTLLKLLIGGVVLMSQGFAQEPKHAIVPQLPAVHTTEQTIASGSPKRPAPVVEPKALPPLSVSLGDIARAERAAHSAAPKAQMIVAEDVAPKEESAEQK